MQPEVADVREEKYCGALTTLIAGCLTICYFPIGCFMAFAVSASPVDRRPPQGMPVYQQGQQGPVVSMPRRSQAINPQAG